MRDTQTFRQWYKHAGGWWEDVATVAAIAFTGGGGTPPSWDATRGGYNFPISVDRVLWIQAEMPHGKMLGTDARPHVHWAPSNTNTGNVVWTLDYWWIQTGDTQGSSPTSQSITVAANGTAEELQEDEFTAISPPASEIIDSHIIAKITRTGSSGSDTFTGNARLLAIDFDIQLDQPGSYGADSKWGA